MSKVSVSLGLNIPIGKEQPIGKDRFDRITPAITITDIDTEHDVDKQIQAAIDAAKKGWRASSEYLFEMIHEEIGRMISLESESKKEGG